MASVEFAFLPDAWLQGIVKGDYKTRIRASDSDKALQSWMRNRPESQGNPCKQMQRALEVGLENLDESASGAAHDEINDRVYELVRLGAEGHQGLWTAMKSLQKAFVHEVAERRRDVDAGTVRTPADARAEFGREMYGAIRIVKGYHEQPEMVAAGLKDGATACVCDWVPEGTTGKALDPYSYELTDTGNAEQLRDLADGDLVWVPAYERWLAWDPDLLVWAGSESELGMAWSRKLAPRIKMAGEKRYQLAEQVDGSDADNALSAAKKLMAWSEKCGSAASLTNTLRVAKSYPEMVSAAERFDANQRLLHCADGTVVELNDDGATVREARREDLCSISTGTPYNPDARSDLWDSYLATFLPDEVLRQWVQRLFGYALFGGNPRGALVFLHGPTGSGKSTIVESVGAALGGYGSAFDLSVFRAAKDQGPRVDLVRILTRRLVFASEAGAEWHLHADQIKKLTGGDTVTARLNFSNTFVERIPAFTPFIATNGVPHIANADPALWRRLLVVPFDQRMAGTDDMAAARLRDEPENQAAILAWLVRGWQAYTERPWHEDIPAVVRRRTRDFQGAVSDDHTWWTECIELTESKSDKETINDIEASYTNYMNENGVDVRRRKNRIALGRWIGEQGAVNLKQRYNQDRTQKFTYWGRVKIKGVDELDLG